MDVKRKLGRVAFSKAFDYAYGKLGKDKQNGQKELFELIVKHVDSLNGGYDLTHMRECIEDENSALHKYIDRIIDESDKNVLKTFMMNFIYEAMLCGTKQVHAAREKYQCNVPWLVLMDPTSACNLHCTGCWAAEYGNRCNLTLEEMDNFIKQGKELGIYFYMYTGGEPLVRKKDLIKLCEMHPDCAFVSFTNGTLVDEEFCQELKRVGNLYLAISLEGFEKANDDRRGKGVYQKVMHAMDLLKENGLIFGTSVAYTRTNCEYVCSDEFINMEIEKGVKFSMYFHLMPVGNDASPELMPTIKQRLMIKDRLREVRAMKDGNGLFCFDFQNDGEFVGGCIAGGRNYFHVNANGDAEPCVFVHYSNTNIRENTLIEILQSPLFMAYHNNQPFNHNHYRPCPMLENPEVLPRLVHESGAHSTDLQSPESVEHLCSKCREYADYWTPIAEELWVEEGHEPEEELKKAVNA